jgi:hypothetical protein
MLIFGCKVTDREMILKGYISEQPIEFRLVVCARNDIRFRRFSTTNHIGAGGRHRMMPVPECKEILGACFSRRIHANLSELSQHLL